MEASLLALGITLVAAALVPLTYGAMVRGAFLGGLGTASWGAGVDLALPHFLVTGALMTVLVLVCGLLLRGSGPGTRTTRRTRSP